MYGVISNIINFQDRIAGDLALETKVPVLDVRGTQIGINCSKRLAAKCEVGLRYREIERGGKGIQGGRGAESQGTGGKFAGGVFVGGPALR
jgi:hypothetical protein